MGWAGCQEEPGPGEGAHPRGFSSKLVTSWSSQFSCLHVQFLETGLLGLILPVSSGDQGRVGRVGLGGPCPTPAGARTVS